MSDKYITISHGLGAINGAAYSDSLEGFLYYYSKGQRFFEADITFTTDGYFVVRHTEAEFSLADFMALKTETFTPLTLSDLIDIVHEYPDIMLDLDVLGVCKFNPIEYYDTKYRDFYIELDELIQSIDPTIYDRLILEVLPNKGTKMFELAKTYAHFKNYLYAEYYLSDVPITNIDILLNVCEWCDANEIRFMSIRTITKEWVEILHSYSIYVMVFPYNDPITMYEFYDIGVDCVFSDRVFI